MQVCDFLWWWTFVSVPSVTYITAVNSSPVLPLPTMHYSDVIMSMMASQITAVSMICLTVCWGASQRKHQSSTPLAFVRGIHRWLVDSLNNVTVTRTMSPLGWRHHDSYILLSSTTHFRIFLRPGHQQALYWPSSSRLHFHHQKVNILFVILIGLKMKYNIHTYIYIWKCMASTIS